MSTPVRWLLREPAGDALVRLFCFPYSGMGASMYAKWPPYVGPAEVLLIQPPARENRLRDPHYGTYEHLADQLVEALEPYLDRPFAFFGHCAGGLPAFETALRLSQTGRPVPERLIVSSQAAPHHCPRDRFLDLDLDGLRGELEHLALVMGGRPPHPALIDMALGVLLEDLGANRAYARATPIRIPTGITVLHWLRDVEITRPEMDGWLEYSDDVRIADIDGEHYDFLGAPQALLDILAEDLARAAQRTGSPA